MLLCHHRRGKIYDAICVNLTPFPLSAVLKWWVMIIGIQNQGKGDISCLIVSFRPKLSIRATVSQRVFVPSTWPPTGWLHSINWLYHAVFFGGPLNQFGGGNSPPIDRFGCRCFASSLKKRKNYAAPQRLHSLNHQCILQYVRKERCKYLAVGAINSQAAIVAPCHESVSTLANARRHAAHPVRLFTGRSRSRLLQRLRPHSKRATDKTHEQSKSKRRLKALCNHYVIHVRTVGISSR